MLVLGALLGACKKSSPPPLPATTATTRPVPTINQGGDIVVAAEGEPGCMDWISTCSGSVWGVWTVETNTMPRAYDFTPDNLYKPSILLAGEAQVQTSPDQVVTYQLNPRAVWSDGQPITSHDFKYTWDQIAHGQNIYDQSGYKDIVSVDDADPRTAVVTFSQPYADWRKLFGGALGVFPSHLLEGQDRDALTKNGYSWSGGPWELAPGGWVRGGSIKLIPNPNYWGKKPDLASVTFRIFTDPAAELQAYASGEVVASYPAPEPATAGYRSVGSTEFSAIGGLDFEALWFDIERAPLNAPAVRQAVAYSLDRTAIADARLGQLLPAPQPLDDLLTPAYGTAYTEPFAKYHPDATMATQLMMGDGWTKGSDGFWTKAAVKASIDLKVPDNSPGLLAEATMVQTQLRTAGFVVTVTPEVPSQLFTHDLPSGAFTSALYPVDLSRQVTGAGVVPAGSGIVDNDPGQCRLFCSTSIPTSTSTSSSSSSTSSASTPMSANYTRVRDPTLDRYLGDLDANLNDNARATDAAQAATILADLVPAIPLVARPDIVVVNTAKIGVEGGTFSHNLAYGPYVYLNAWYLK